MGSYATDFQVLSDKTDLITLKTDVLVCAVYQEEQTTAKASSKSKKNKEDEKKTVVVWSPALKSLDKALGGYIADVLESEKFKGDCGKKRIFHVRKSDGIKARWIVVLGLGLPEKLTVKKAIKAFNGAIKEAYGFEKAHQAAIVLPDKAPKVSANQLAQSLVFGLVQSTYKTAEADEKKIPELKNVSLIPAKKGAVDTTAVDEARIMAMAEAFTKDLANKPANLKTADCLAQAALSYKSLPGVTVEVVSDQKKLKKEMPCFWAVAQGAAQADPPRFIKVTYTPSGKGKIKKKIALVGKGVIFDTGGVQVKPGDYMNDMKFDMTGAATVLSTLRAAAELKLKGIQVTAYVAATQNLTGETAYLPDSIIDTASGRKVEIRHTDAEGRLTLADAVYKAVQDKPDELVTIATLTGAAGIAVGFCTALMGTDDDLLNRLEKSAKAVGEDIQKLEMLEEDFEDIKSDRDAADLSNTGKGKGRGHLKAGAFVLTFAEKVPAAHLDIAGGDAKDGNATGIAVKGLIEYLKQEAS